MQLAAYRLGWSRLTGVPVERVSAGFHHVAAGVTLRPVFTGETLRRPNPIFWEHEGNRAVRDGKWKLVAKENESWELYDIDADRALFTPNGVVTAVIEIGTTLGGKPRLQRQALLRATDAAPSTVVSVYRDRGSDMILRVTWHGKNGQTESKTQVLDSDYVLLSAPNMVKASGDQR